MNLQLKKKGKYRLTFYNTTTYILIAGVLKILELSEEYSYLQTGTQHVFKKQYLRLGHGQE